ncbi:MAG: hypothetical protein H6622_05505 [Halobacteriovoraceae bacterium]|nr:hypothetical protein [Halobacteriovoraceae bacterium]
MKPINLILFFILFFSIPNGYGKENKTICEKEPNKTRYGQKLILNSQCAMNLAGWECKDGFIQRRDKCLKLQIPKNAVLNEDNHTWSCLSGYRKYRNVCKKIKLPKNAHLTEDGHDWICSEGYTRSKHHCIKN